MGPGQLFGAASLAPHIRVKPKIANELGKFIGNMLGDSSDELPYGINLEVLFALPLLHLALVYDFFGFLDEVDLLDVEDIPLLKKAISTNQLLDPRQVRY